jgi:hypothetical protein
VGAFTPASFRFQRGEGGNGGSDDADRWVPPVGEGKRERGYRFGFCGEWAAGCFWSWAERLPWGPFLFLFSFFFSFSVFFIPFIAFAN